MEIESYHNDSMIVEDDSTSDDPFNSNQQPQMQIQKKRSKKKRESPMDSMMVSWKLGRQPIPPDIAAYTENIRRQNLLELDEDLDMMQGNNGSNPSNESLYLLNGLQNQYQQHQLQENNVNKQNNQPEVSNVSHNKPTIPKLDFNSTKFYNYNQMNNISNNINNNNNNNNSNEQTNIVSPTSGNHTGNSEKLPSVHEILPNWVPSTNSSPNQSPRTFSVTSPVGSTSSSPRGTLQPPSPMTSPRLNSFTQQSNFNYSSTYSPRIPPPPSPIVTSGNLPLSSPHGYGGYNLGSPHPLPQSPSTIGSQSQTTLIYTTSSPNDSPRVLQSPNMKGKGTSLYHNGLSPVNSPRLSSPHYSESLLSINHSHTTSSTNSVSLEELMRMKLGQN